MGRVHKKKLAEYAEENDELNKSKEKEGEAQKSAIDLEGSGSEDGNESNNARSATKKVNAAHDDDGDYEGNDDEDEDFKSLQGDDEVQEDADAAGKKSHKRKALEKVGKKEAAADKNDGGSSDEDEPLGSGPSPSKKSRKAVGGGKVKAAATKNGKTAKGGSKDKKAAKKPQEDDVEEEGEAEEDEEEEEEYEVKEIVDHKVERGVSYFLIRWKGYAKDDDTWEPEDTLSCPDIIEKYKKKQSTDDGGKPGKKAASPAKKGRTEKGGKVDPNKEWEVDKIIDYAEEKTGRVFRIRWKGFGPKHDTWEPEENLYCDEIIDKFMKRMKTQENVSFKELRQEPKKPKRLVNETVPRTHFNNPVGRTSKRAVSKKRVYYGDSDE